MNKQRTFKFQATDSNGKKRTFKMSGNSVIDAQVKAEDHARWTWDAKVTSIEEIN